jgi:putative transposase
MAEWCSAHQVEIWAYCLMPNRVHLIAVPVSADALGRAIGEAHGRYTRMVNPREGWPPRPKSQAQAQGLTRSPFLAAASRLIESWPADTIIAYLVIISHTTR